MCTGVVSGARGRFPRSVEAVFPFYCAELRSTRSRPTGWALGAPQAYKWSLKGDSKPLYEANDIKKACSGSEQSPNYPKPFGNQLEPPKYAQNLQNRSKIEDFAKSSWNLTTIGLRVQEHHGAVTRAE